MELTELDTAIQESIPATEEHVDDIIDDADILADDGKEGKEKPVDDKQGKEKDGEGNDDDTDGTDDVEGVEVDDKDKKPDQTPKPKRNKFQERIDEKTREVYELRQKLETIQAELESKPPELPPKPDPSKYTFDKTVKGDFERAQAQYHQDVGKWEAKCESITTAHEKRGEQRIQAEQQKYFSKMSAEKSIFGDYDTAVRSLSSYAMTPELHEALATDDNNTDLFCFLGNPKNHTIAEKAMTLKGYAQSRYLAEISFKLQAAKTRQQAKPSNSKSPVGKPKGGKGGGGALDIEKMSDSEYRKLMGKAKAKVGHW